MHIYIYTGTTAVLYVCVYCTHGRILTDNSTYTFTNTAYYVRMLYRRNIYLIGVTRRAEQRRARRARSCQSRR